MEELVVIKGNEIEVQKEAVKKLKEFKIAKAKMDMLEKELNKALKEAMEKIGKTDLIVEGLAVKYKKPYTKKTLDTKKLKEDLPDIYETYEKESQVSGSVTLTFGE